MMLAYMAGLLGLIIVVLQSKFHYWLFGLADQPIDLEAPDLVNEGEPEENTEAQEQRRIVSALEAQQTQTSEQIPPLTAIQQDDVQMESIKIALKVSIGIGGITGSMIGVLVGNEQKKSNNIFLRISNSLLWASFVLSVILTVITLLSIKNKQLVIIVKVAMYATIVLLILTVVDLFIVYMKSGNI